MESSQLRYFAYVRKSTDDRSKQQLTIEAQLHEIKQFAKGHNLYIVDTFEERESAKTPGRPVFQKMINEVKAGQANGILAWHPDRLSRNSLDGGEIIYLLDTGVLKDLKFPQSWFENTPQGKYVLYQAFANSKLEVDTISTRVKAAYKEKARRGILPTKPPVGYKNNKKLKTIVVDRKAAPFIVRTFEMCATGEYTVPQIRAELTKEGFLTKARRPLSLSKYHFILNHTFYYGPFKYGGEWYSGSHERLISKKVSDAAIKNLKRKERKWSRNFRPFLYRGRMMCAECGAMISFEIQKGHGYLRCTKKLGHCSQRYLRQEHMNEKLSQAISQIALPKECIAELKASYSDHRSKLESILETKRQTLNSALDDQNNVRESLLQLLVSKLISEDEFRLMKSKTIFEVCRLQQEIEDLDPDKNNPLEPIEETLQWLSEATDLNEQGSESEKFEFLKKAGSNLKLRDGILLVTWKKPFELAADWKSRSQGKDRKHVLEDTNTLLLALLGTIRP
jgi:site-specific DNA recombinase